MLHVVLDGCCLGRRKTGNETYIRGLIDGLAELAVPDLDLEIITTDQHQGKKQTCFNWKEIPLGNFASRNFLTIPRFLRRTRRKGSTLYHATYWTRFWSMPVPAVVMIHDISFVSFPQGYRSGERLVYETLIKAAAKNAAHILTVSEYSKRDICERWGIPEEKVTFTYEAVSDDFRPAESETTASLDPYILYVGNLHPRKNLVRLLEAFVQLKQETRTAARLRIVGQKAWLYGDIFETVRKHRLEDQVDFTGYVSQDELVRCYQQALFSIYPSLFEGFGFPVLEAMASGCPVITSGTTSLPEVAGDAALLINPESVEEMAAAMNRLLRDGALRTQLREQGLKRAAQFSWRKAAEQTLAVYRKVAALS